MKQDQKNELIGELAEKFQTASALYLTDFTGIDVERMQNLRTQFREGGSEYRVVKNTLAKRALQNAGFSDEVQQCFEGPTGIAFGYDDPVSPAKVITEFMKKRRNESFSVKACILDKQIYASNKISEIAKMPNKEQLLGQLSHF